MTTDSEPEDQSSPSTGSGNSTLEPQVSHPLENGIRSGTSVPPFDLELYTPPPENIMDLHPGKYLN
jgi:hypothetical protein